MMLIYLDANIVQYCADYYEIIFDERAPVGIDSALLPELLAIRRLVELEQLGSWEFAAPRYLLNELYAGRPGPHQLEVYQLLEDANRREEPDPQAVAKASECLLPLELAREDRREIANALTMGASWFLTNDGDIIRRTGGWVELGESFPLFAERIPVSTGVRLRIARPTECLPEISQGLFLW